MMSDFPIPAISAGDTDATISQGEPAIPDVPSLLAARDWRAITALNLVPDYVTGSMSFTTPDGLNVWAADARLETESVVYVVIDSLGAIKAVAVVAAAELGTALRSALAEVA